MLPPPRCASPAAARMRPQYDIHWHDNRREMMTTTYYIGLDVHKDTISAAVAYAGREEA
ncbi:hypothetical protein GCM10010869_05640 [Mesorhizobium tianshanense]|nr:hypothetical protein GCM10010869_05640 [Mesorhizobium tianshanense]